MNNLILRILTALVLLLGLTGLLFFATLAWFNCIILLVGALAVWEVWRLLQAKKMHVFLIMLLIYGFTCAALLHFNPLNFLIIAATVHLPVTAYLLISKPKLQTLFAACYSATYIGCVIIAVLVLYKAGAWVLLTAMLMVWAADVGGYFFGRGFGGRFIKAGLAPTISPKKSWEGAIGGALLAAMLAVVILKLQLVHSWTNVGTAHHLPLVWVFVITLILAAYSVTGDLVESLMKRQVGVKDSSQLLPGHGGILDRIDALIPVLPLCAAWVLYHK